MANRASLSRTEFIALMAMMTANIAFSVDAMLPSLPDIAQDLSPNAPNLAMGVLLIFVLGIGLGTMLAGPLSDAMGRKPVILVSSALFCVGAALAFVAPTIETLLIARLIQGLGASGPRVVVVAIIRDLYQGREMAKIQSFVMMIFALVPAVAPLIGQQIIAISHWRAIFLAFILFALVFTIWYGLRQPETLPPARRRPMRRATIWAAVKEVLANRIVSTAILIQILGFAMLFGTLSTVQPVFEVTFDRGQNFPLWFGLVALISITASMLNARYVGIYGMRRIIGFTLTAQIALSALCSVIWVSGIITGPMLFWVFLVWMISVFYQAAPLIGNVNALAMQPVGHIAGLAASVITCLATVGGALLAAPIALLFDGTPLPLMLCVLICALCARALIASLPPDADSA